ncbi:MAG: hypothetical protein GYA58_03270 [Anaerolineaceae bacterium]|nr:hypothetical protein [Anaerolineaceae bacterium]
MKNYWIDIENNNGVRFGAGPLRPSTFRISKLLSGSGEFEFEVSGLDPNIALLREKRTAICRYIDDDGTIRALGGGIIDQVSAQSIDGSLVYTVSGNDLCRELTYRSVGALQLAEASTGVLDGPSRVMALAPTGWAIINGVTQELVYNQFEGENVLNALTAICDRIGEQWRLGAGRQIIWLGPASDFDSCGVRAIQHVNDTVAFEGSTEVVIITKLEEIRDAADVITRLIPRGSGNGNVVATLAAATNAALTGYTLNKAENYLRNDAAESLYGRIERVIDFKDLGPVSNTDVDVQSASNMLLQASFAYLERYKQPLKAYKIQLAGANRLLEPGSTMRVVYRKITDGNVIQDIDQVLNIIRVDQVIDANGLHTSGVEVSTIDRQPVSDVDFLVSQAQSAKVFTAHPQLSASVDNLSYRDEMDDSHPCVFRFWLGLEYTTIQQALLRFRIQPLRSTVKSVAGQSTTTASGGGSTSGNGGGSSQTSSSGGSTVATATDAISWGNANTTLNIYVDSTHHYHGIGSTMHSHPVYIPNHTHTVDIPSHTHSTPNHTHTLTPNIHMEYGIFEESAANTLSLEDLVIKINGGADVRFNAIELGSGWYAIDLTNEVINEIFRPKQESNQVTISTSIEKSARIEAQLTLRGVVQAVAYL